MSILEDAIVAVGGARLEDYGHPLVNHTRTAALWTAYLRERITGEVTAEDVCFLNILQKVSRSMAQSERVKEDTLVDIAGFAENVERIQVERARRAK